MRIRRTTVDILVGYARILAYSLLAYLLLILGLAFFSAFRLLDLSLIVSLWVAEVPVAYGLYYFLERKRAAVSQAIDLIDLAEKYKHLRIHMFRRGFGFKFYTVENTTMRLAFDPPDYLMQLANWDLIQVVKHRNEEAFENDLKGRNVTNKSPQVASPEDLLRS